MKVSIYKDASGGKWRVRWFGAYDPDTGKQRRYSKSFSRRKDAEHFQKAKAAEFDGGMRRDPCRETLESYCRRWIESKAAIENLRPATVDLYELCFRRLRDHFGPGAQIRQIDRRAAKEFLAALRPLGDRQEFGPWSRHRVQRQCRTLFGEAVKDGILPKNPFEGIAKPNCTPRDWYYVKPAEFARLIDKTPKLREKVLYALCYTAGLRLTEALALQWASIDFETGRVRLENRPASGQYPPFELKDSDARTIPLPPMTIDLLTRLNLEAPDGVPFVLMDRQGCENIRRKWADCQKEGRPWMNRYFANNVVRNFHRRVKWAGIDTEGKALTVHTLRKCCGQNWAETLPMNVVKHLMGHSTIATTERFYSTVDDDHYKRAAAAMDKLLRTGLAEAGEKKTDQKLTISGDFGQNQQEQRPDDGA